MVTNRSILKNGTIVYHTVRRITGVIEEVHELNADVVGVRWDDDVSNVWWNRVDSFNKGLIKVVGTQ